ncbi:flagellar biosynthesis protein FlhF [Desulfotalea psychrophila]|nr:flagellar biosynthesis protein FlhF [Desulfocapsa sp.]MBN4071615.1 flagellar biosynthesis protein FlhF [Desulfotalea psychrophila]
MQVRIFESQDLASGLKMVKDELGPDALILSTKTIRSGKLGMLGKKYIEITAAVDSMWPHKGGTSVAKPIKHKPAIATTDDKKQDETPLTYNSSLQLNRRTTSADQEVMPVVPIRTQPPKTEDQTDLQIEVSELKGMIKNLGQEMLRLNTSNRSPTAPPGSDPSSVASESSLRSLHQRLLDYGISPDTAQTISTFAKESLTLEELSDPFKQQQYVAETIQERIQVNTDIFKDVKRQHRVALVGPTGVGKTTTLAKIAARFLVKHSPNIGFITIDTYRIAAVEQLKVYGDIMNIPVEVVLSPEQLENALLNFREKDLVLIDTAGRSPQDELSINELASFLRPDFSIKKHLVLSATTRENELFNAMQRFSVLGIDNTIITKTDECTSLGLLLDIQVQEEIPFSYITNGQRVPEDIMEANKETLSQLIMSPGKGLVYE